MPKKVVKCPRCNHTWLRNTFLSLGMNCPQCGALIGEPPRAKFSETAAQSEAGARCPRCGGMNFKAKRSGAGKAAVGFLAPKTQVKCESCGLVFRRG